MRICVCGLGKVGRPILEAMREAGHEAVGYDCNVALTEVSADTAVQRSEAVIIIVPTPSLDDGSFDNYQVRSALHRFNACARGQGKNGYLYIVASTVMPGSCDAFRKIVGDNICYKPEFVRTINKGDVEHDLRNPAFHLIGSITNSAAAQCLAIYDRVADVPFRRMSLIEAELAKITLNCALTMKISLANQLHLVASKVGANSEVIMDAVGTDPRIGNAYLKPGWPYGGPCLPRDNRMFQFVARSLGIDAAMSKAADTINEHIRSEGQ